MHESHRQADYRLRFDWGSLGAQAITPGADVVVVVDVLSFTTTLSVAADQGIEVFPYRWKDASVMAYAEDNNAVLAVDRTKASAGQVSLSPASIRAATGVRRLVLPSPNGSTLCHQIASTGTRVVGVSLRNRRAVANWLLARRRTVPAFSVAVLAAGERWPDGSLRPAVEDLWGAGALICALFEAGWGLPSSPEAHAAAASWQAVADRLGHSLQECASGRELIQKGYRQDVLIAAELDLSPRVPVLVGSRFIAQGKGRDAN